MEQKNWFGMEPHPTDNYICYQQQHIMSREAFNAHVLKIRAAWDKLAACDSEALAIIVGLAYSDGCDTVYESMAGASL